MKEAVQEKQTPISERLGSLLSFTPSDKFKYAVKASLSVMLVYLISFSQGWDHATTAADAVLLIAVAGTVAQSVMKGLLRLSGTIIGAVIGIALIALFPQERMLFLFSLSVLVTFFFYLARAYKGDMTVFTLISLTMMLVFYDGSNADQAFLYGIHRTYMIVFGIAVFTLVGILLWPAKVKEGMVGSVVELLDTQLELYRKREAERSVRKALYEKLQTQEIELESSAVAIASDTESLSRSQRNTLFQDIKSIDETLMLLSYHDESDFADKYSEYIKNFDRADKDIEHMLFSLKRAVTEKKEIEIPPAWEADYNDEAMRKLSHIDRAAMTATVMDIRNLHRQLRCLAEKFNTILSPYPTSFDLSEVKTSAFNWLDIEDIKGSLVTFLIFWTTVAFWILVNPPGGFFVVTLATYLSVLTTYSLIKPTALIILFTFSFIFATAMYVFVLPNLHYAWELGLFLFLYAFIGFYFINLQIAIFFLLGSTILYIVNPMYYNFQLFLIVLFMFYLFLFTLLLFYYIPFSTKPEVMFRIVRRRFFRLSANLLERSNRFLLDKDSFWGRIKAWYARNHLMNSARKMQIWAGKIDTNYFDTLDAEKLIAFTKECETFAYLLQMMYTEEISSTNNALIQRLKEENIKFDLSRVLTQYAQGKEPAEIKSIWRDDQKIIAAIEEHLVDFFSYIEPDKYTPEEMIRFYEFLAIRRNVWVSFFNCQNLMEELDFAILERSRF